MSFCLFFVYRHCPNNEECFLWRDGKCTFKIEGEIMEDIKILMEQIVVLLNEINSKLKGKK